MQFFLFGEKISGTKKKKTERTQERWNKRTCNQSHLATQIRNVLGPIAVRDAPMEKRKSCAKVEQEIVPCHNCSQNAGWI
jgi:hypothetical protein